MSLNVTIRELTVADLDQVMEIEHANFHYPWPKSFFHDDLVSPQSVCRTGWVKDRLVSYVIARVADIELHVLNVAVDKAFQHRGIGSFMMQQVEREGLDRGCLYAYLEVRVSNKMAIAMYNKLGYHTAYTRSRYYLDGEDAYVMEKLL